jgi:hypothetical protein
MSKLRFATARSLFETFPELVAKSANKSAPPSALVPSDDPPLTFLRRLATQDKSGDKFGDAVAFCAHLLPRREAVWWACTSARTFLSGTGEGDAASLLVAEAWVAEPSDERRRAALEAGQKGDSNDPLTWVALAAGWSGGLLASHPQMSAPVPVPQYLTARAVHTAILLSAHFCEPARLGPAQRRCIEDGIRLAESGVNAPP